MRRRGLSVTPRPPSLPELPARGVAQSRARPRLVVPRRAAVGTRPGQLLLSALPGRSAHSFQHTPACSAPLSSPSTTARTSDLAGPHHHGQPRPLGSWQLYLIGR